MAFTPLDAISLEWIKGYVDQLLAMAEKFEEGSRMRQAAALRAEHAMDLVELWKRREEQARSV